MEVSKIGAEISGDDGIDRNTLCGRKTREGKCSSTSYERGELHTVFWNDIQLTIDEGEDTGCE
jgi:hypothetical protein